ncbi:glycoside hydrolase family 65 protein [Bacillaceae bacterium IKA-2]|nr:glycoside hydrolase family 65 protein [Bacillaceae bacterium IKA-2]
MKQYLKLDEWSIIEEGFDPENHEVSESVFSIGNGHMGQRANFEEDYSGKSLQGSYLAGVYYPDKTRVGWWKNGYPEYFAKVLNATNWIGLSLEIAGENLDLHNLKVSNFVRTLNMKKGFLERSFVVTFSDGKEVKINVKRFVSLVDKEIGAIRYSLTPVNFDGELKVTSYLDGDIKNQDANYDEKFWGEVAKEITTDFGTVTIKTKKSNYLLCSTMKTELFQDGEKLSLTPELTEKEKYLSHTFTHQLQSRQETVIYKYVSNVTSRDYDGLELAYVGKKRLQTAITKGFEKMLTEQAGAWSKKWEQSDIVIDGDVSAQQGIRFNIFQLNQTYTGEDDRLNIGPKGFTGEKYGGSTYWDTEAYCLPFYLSTADPKISKNLLIYRYKHLQKAIENAEKLGFSGGAALYPMVTMNGEESHNEWEITFEEIHRNGAIAYAIYNYVTYTNDKSYLGEYGLEVLVAISRFWAQRVNYVKAKDQYMILGVTGPNEYENNVNNNWYTNRIAAWTLEYTLSVIDYLKETDGARFKELQNGLNIIEGETDQWVEISTKMYFPFDKESNVFLQQDGFLDKELIAVKDLDKKHLPLNQTWSWDRILRSCFIKQADVLQGIYFLNDEFDIETKKKNFDFYEPMTVHESSLSPCVHAILACELGYKDKAYEMYLRTSRLDLDNYNNDTEDGCHITSMAGTWLSVVQGFGGVKVSNDQLILNPFIPTEWKSFAFKIGFRGVLLTIKVSENEITITNETEKAMSVIVHSNKYIVNGNDHLAIEH